MLAVNQLSRNYGHFRAVGGVSFAIQKGEIVGLLGHNGAGKTTIMKMLSGFLEPDGGSVLVDDIDLIQSPKRVQSLLGYMPENLPIYPEMTVVSYLDYAAELKGLCGSKKIQEVKRVVDATDIRIKLSDRISTLSRGYKQRVGVAQAILGDPKLLILDEPTNGLDPEQTNLMRSLIRQIANDATVILSTHIMQEVDALCSRVLIVRAGELALDSTLAELRKSQQVIVECSLDETAMAGLNRIDGIQKIEKVTHGNESIDGEFTYRISLNSSSDERNVSAKISQYVIDKKASLYSIRPDQRDLEAVFKEVNESYISRSALPEDAQQQESEHAA